MCAICMCQMESVKSWIQSLEKDFLLGTQKVRKIQTLRSNKEKVCEKQRRSFL